VKYALAKMGLIEASYRLPLVPPSAESQTKIKNVLEELGMYPTGLPAKEKAYAASTGRAH
jgi:dihydrodipicolinate synthase/N-acetylneuraminate lyase